MAKNYKFGFNKAQLATQIITSIRMNDGFIVTYEWRFDCYVWMAVWLLPKCFILDVFTKLKMISTTNSRE